MRLTAMQQRRIHERFDSGLSIQEVAYAHWDEDEHNFIRTLKEAMGIVEQVLRSHIRKLEKKVKKKR